MRKYYMKEIVFRDFSGKEACLVKDFSSCEMINLPLPDLDTDRIVEDCAGVWIELAKSCNRIDTVSPACWLYAYSRRPEKLLPLLWYRLSKSVIYDYEQRKYFTAEDRKLIGPRPFIPTGRQAKTIVFDYVRHIIDNYDYKGDIVSFVSNMDKLDDSGVVSLASYLIGYKLSILRREAKKSIVNFGPLEKRFLLKDFTLGRRYAYIGQDRVPLLDFVRDYYSRS